MYGCIHCKLVCLLGRASHLVIHFVHVEHSNEGLSSVFLLFLHSVSIFLNNHCHLSNATLQNETLLGDVDILSNDLLPFIHQDFR